MCCFSEFSAEIRIAETFWIDLVLRNPLDAEINLSNMTVIVQESNTRDSSSAGAFADVELVDDVVLAPKESRMVRKCPEILRDISNGCVGSDMCQVAAAGLSDDNSRHLRISFPSSLDGGAFLSWPETAGHVNSTAEAHVFFRCDCKRNS
jgi:hypothetical protein